jgi:pimeloyl-ACP methyl ester carboxylesterase
MTLERLTQDAIEIAEYAQDKLDKDKLVLVGQSWGSMIGWTALRRPDLFHAYVGTGQVVSWARTVEGQEAYARAQAQAAGDEAALQAMNEAREAPLLSFERIAPFRPWIMPPSDLAFIEMQRDYVGPGPIPQEGGFGTGCVASASLWKRWATTVCNSTRTKWVLIRRYRSS